jgi:metal-responsive CopG/Arc/MetJ family transcriptional regulator
MSNNRLKKVTTMGLAEIKIPHNLLEELDRVAKRTSKSRSFHVQKAIRLYLEEYMDLEIALKRAKNKKDRLISSDQLKKRLGI